MRVGDAEIDAELDRDPTISGQENAAAARASRPDAEAKARGVDRRWWRTPTSRTRRTGRSRGTFMRYGQEELLAPYVEKYLEAADTAWEELGTHMASNLLEDASRCRWAARRSSSGSTAGWRSRRRHPAAKRYVREGRADVVRALAAQDARRAG